MNFDKRIIIDPNIMVGKPIIKGTRITVELVLRQLAQGLTPDDILTNYPHLTKEDIFAAIAYANELVQEEQVYQLTPIQNDKAKAFVG